MATKGRHSSALLVNWSTPIIRLALRVMLFTNMYSDSSSAASSGLGDKIRFMIAPLINSAVPKQCGVQRPVSLHVPTEGLQT